MTNPTQICSTVKLKALYKQNLNTTKMPILTTFIQYCIGSHSYTNDRGRNTESIQNGKEEVNCYYMQMHILYL